MIVLLALAARRIRTALAARIENQIIQLLLSQFAAIVLDERVGVGFIANLDAFGIAIIQPPRLRIDLQHAHG